MNNQALLKAHITSMVSTAIEEYRMGVRDLPFNPSPDVTLNGIREPRNGADLALISEMIAQLAFCPGGIDVLGIHFEAQVIELAR